MDEALRKKRRESDARSIHLFPAQLRLRSGGRIKASKSLHVPGVLAVLILGVLLGFGTINPLAQEPLPAAEPHSGLPMVQSTPQPDTVSKPTPIISAQEDPVGNDMGAVKNNGVPSTVLHVIEPTNRSLRQPQVAVIRDVPGLTPIADQARPKETTAKPSGHSGSQSGKPVSPKKIQHIHLLLRL